MKDKEDKEFYITTAIPTDSPDGTLQDIGTVILNEDQYKQVQNLFAKFRAKIKITYWGEHFGNYPIKSEYTECIFNDLKSAKEYVENLDYAHLDNDGWTFHIKATSTIGDFDVEEILKNNPNYYGW